MIHTRQREADRPGGFRSGQKPQRIFTAVITYKNYIILNNNSSRTRKQARLFPPSRTKNIRRTITGGSYARRGGKSQHGLQRQANHKSSTGASFDEAC